MKRSCADCQHCKASLCNHSQARYAWGFLTGMHGKLSDEAWREWPEATSPCGFFKPVEAWVSALTASCLKKKDDASLTKIVRRKAA